MKKLLLVLFIASSFSIPDSNAQNAGDYRTVASGNWNNASIWQRYNGSSWSPTASPPSSSDGKITIVGGDTVVTDSELLVDELIVNAGAVLHLTFTSEVSALVLTNGPGVDMICNGHLMVDGRCALDRDVVGGATIEYTYDTLTNNGGITPSLTFNGSQPQKIVGSGYMGPITLNNTNNLEIQGSTSFASVNFLNGKINVTGDGIFITTQFSSTFTGQSASRFIDGKVDCIMYEKDKPFSFLLPVGKGNEYLPMVLNITTDSDVETHFNVTISDGSPPLRTLPPSLDKVSSIRYFTITKGSSGANVTNASIQLSYVERDKVNDPSNLRIVKSNNSNWENIGGVGTGSPIGTITSTINFTSFSDFVLANASGGSNTLPLNIISFNATAKGNSVLLTWKTSNEKDVEMYEIERKEIGEDWKQVARVTTNDKGNYSYTDASSKTKELYQYRIKQVNKDGTSFYSKQLAVKLENKFKGMSIERIYPNPVGDILTYVVSAPVSDLLTVRIIDMNGSIIQTFTGNTNQVTSVAVKLLKDGTYLMNVYNNRTGERAVKEFLKK